MGDKNEDNEKEILRVKPYNDTRQKPKFKYKLPKALGLDKTFSCLCIGGTGAGKSTIIRHFIKLLAKNVKKANRFFFSPTALDDDTLTGLFNEDQTFTEYSDPFFEGIVEMIKKENEERLNPSTLTKDGRKRPSKAPQEYLMVFDDFIGKISKNKGKIWGEFTRNRHAHINIFFASQTYKSLPVLTRFNATCYIILGSVNRKELKNIVEELNKRYDNALFEKMFLEKVYKVPYSFLYINNRTGTYSINFIDEFITKEEEEYWEKHKRLPTDIETLDKSDVKSDDTINVKNNEKSNIKKGILEIVDNPYIKMI